MIHLSGLLIPMSTIAMVVLIVWIYSISRREAIEQRANLIRHMVDNFSSGEAFAEALQGPDGSRLAETLSLEEVKPRQGWMGLFIGGAISGCLGLGFFVLAVIRGNYFVIPGVILFAVGTGMLVSAYVARRAMISKTNQASENAGNASLGGDFRGDRGTDLK